MLLGMGAWEEGGSDVSESDRTRMPDEVWKQGKQRCVSWIAARGSASVRQESRQVCVRGCDGMWRSFTSVHHWFLRVGDE